MTVSRAQAPETVENPEASESDMPKQGNISQRDLRDAEIIAKVLAIVTAECDRAKAESNAASAEGRASDMYRHNTALHALWAVAAKIGALSSPLIPTPAPVRPRVKRATTYRPTPCP